jgi:hypothetical protein
MARKRRISADAARTTVALTVAQQLAIQELMLKRLREGNRKPLLNEVVIEGLEALLRNEGWTETDLAQVFPKPKTYQAKIRSIGRGRRSAGSH